MATLVEAWECTYEWFVEVRREMNTRNKFGLMSSEYDKIHFTARFWFHDAKYIPLWMYSHPQVRVNVPTEFLNNIIQVAIDAKSPTVQS